MKPDLQQNNTLFECPVIGKEAWKLNQGKWVKKNETWSEFIDGPKKPVLTALPENLKSTWLGSCKGAGPCLKGERNGLENGEL